MGCMLLVKTAPLWSSRKNAKFHGLWIISLNQTHDDVSFERMLVKCGVPRGSILRALYFLQRCMLHVMICLMLQHISFLCNLCWRYEHHDDVIKRKHFPRNWPFVRGIHRSPVNSPHKSQWRGALMFSLICVWINGWVNNVRLVIWDAIVPIMTSL